MPRKTQKEHRSRNDRNDANDEINSRNKEDESRSRSDGLRTNVDVGILMTWMNKELNKVGRHVEDLCVDLRNGRNIILLLEILSGVQIPKRGGRLRIHMLENLRTILVFLKRHNIDTTNIREEDILDGDLNATTILISTILLHSQKFGKVSTEDNTTHMRREGNTEVPIAMQRENTGHINSKNVGAEFRDSDFCTDTRGRDTIVEFDFVHIDSFAVSDHQREAIEEDEIKLFWKTRRESLRKFVLPCYKCEDEIEPKWEISGWSSPLLSEEMGDAKRVLLDAFFIYLVRVVGEARLHVGWNAPETKTTRSNAEHPDTMIPMAVTVWLDEPWSSVSNAVDDELLLLSNYNRLPLDVMSEIATRDPVSFAKTTWLPQIVVSMVANREVDTRYSRVKGKTLTLEIDDSGHYRWIYDEQRVKSNAIQKISERLRHLVNALLTADNDEIPIYKLIMKLENDHGLFLRDWVATKQNLPTDIDHRLFEQQVIEQCRMRRKNSVASIHHSVYPNEKVSDDRNQKQQNHKVPRNLITPHTTKLTPDLLPLISFTQADIDYIIGEVPEGLTNIQDIYALTPVQDSILFHNTLSNDENQASLVCQIAFTDRSLLERYLHAVQRVVNRNDILRTAFFWENISTPAQVVFRQAPLTVAETTPCFQPNNHAIDLNEAPLIRYVITRDVQSGWILHELIHLLIIDRMTLEIFHTEVQAHINGKASYLQNPTPFRNIIAEIECMRCQEHSKNFFTSMLAGIDEPTLLFGPAEIDRRSSRVKESHSVLSTGLSDRLRLQARDLNVSLETLCHVGWAGVVAKASGRRNVVFGTVVFRGTSTTGQYPDSIIGPFENTLPLCVDVDDTAVEECLNKTHYRLSQLLEHEHASLSSTQRYSSVTHNLPLFNALLRYKPNRCAMNSGSLTDGLEFFEVEQRANCPVTLTVSEEGTTLTITAQISGRIWPDRVCGYMQQSLESLCHAVKYSPKLPMRSLQTIPEVERMELLQLSKGAKLPHNDFPCMHQLFEEQVVRVPGAIALVYEDQSITYADLNSRANRLARQLFEMGVLPGERVAVCMAPTPVLIAGLLAISKIGGTYVPIDPAYPSERTIHVLSDTKPRIILADEVGRTAIGNTALLVLTVYDPNILPDLPEHNLNLQQLTSELLAYVIYTSGSTGKPKGVMVEHRNIVRTLNNVESLFYFDEHDTWCLLQSIAFAYSMWGIWGALSYGCKIIIPSNNLSLSPQKLQQLIYEHDITILNLTPSALKTFSDNYSHDLALNKLRYIFLSGERLDPRILRSWYTAHEHVSSQVINMYGLTETPFFGAYKFLNKLDTDALVSPMGMRVPGTKLYLLDSHLEPVPIGAVGEIYIGGPTVARGYLNRPDLTAERFFSDPFNEALDSRVYRTGDMAYYSADGNLIYVSRNDQQVKIRGFRIEPCEVEACLVTHPAVRHALVIVVSNEYVDRLIAYVIAETVNNLTIALHEHVSTRLPSYMVPSAFIQLREFPLTQNGKIDRSALLKLDQMAFISNSYEAPKGPVEIALADIWGKLLGLKNVSRRDSFYELGGHSLLAVSIIEHMRALGWTLSMQNLFNHPILSDLADTVKPRHARAVPPNVITEDSKTLTPDMLPLIDLAQKDVDLIVAKVPGGIANIQDIYSLSPLQDGILFHNLLSSDNDPYLVTSFVIFDNNGLLSRYLSAVQRMVDRHDILRTSFIWKELSTPAQVVWRNALISITELTLTLDEDSVRNQLSWESTHSTYRFNFEEAPLIRFVVTRATSGRWIALQIMHHLIGDETTVRMMHIEMQSHLNEKPDLLPPTPYRNLISNIRFEVNQEVHIKFFTEMLSEVDSSTLPFGLDKMHVDKSQVTQTSYILASNLVECLRRQAKNLNIAFATLSHVAWALVLSRVCDQEKVVFGTVLSGRMHAGEGFDTAIGLYINTLPLLLNVDETSVETSLRKAHTSLAQLVEHEYASLALAQRCSSLPTGRSLFNSLLNFRRYPSITDRIQYLQGIEFHDGIEYTNYPLTITIDDSPDAVRLTAHVLRPICSDRLCAYTNQALESLVNALDTTPWKSICLLEILPSSEMEPLHETRTTSGAVRPDELCVHQLFELQAEQNPNAIALVYEGQTLTYAELNTQANRLARKLIDLGVSPEQRVALCVARSPVMVIGLIAIMKSGAAYVPIDPAYPSERSAHILNDAKPSIALVDDVGRDALGEIIHTISTVLDPNAGTSFSDADANSPHFISSNLAYIIYTSGSTGKPKGVMVEHRNIVRLFSGTDFLVDFDRQDTWCLFHSIAFDVSVWELWGALSTGAKLIIVPHHVSRSMQDTQQLLHEYNVTVLNLTPTAFRMFIEDFQNTHLSNDLRYIILAGERLDPGTIRSWYAIDKESVPDVINMYGSTETTVHTTFKKLRKLDAEESISPIGDCMLGKKIYLLDSKHRPVPRGVVGEIYISGAGVTRGYLNRLDITRERFLEDVYSDVLDSRMYRTGDMAHRLSDGSLAYVGRNDEQIKIRGFRIEPCEIEACLVTHPSVHQALVLVVSTEYVDHLVAYVIATTSNNLIAELHQHATARLPEYMVPSAFVHLAEFPLTQNGKIDRSALMKLDRTNVAERNHEAPEGPIETALADIWRNLLSLENIGRRDSFFALGGHSLLAIRIIEYMRSLGWKLTAQNLFDRPVLSDLADTITKHYERKVPPNMITEDCTMLTPDMLPLIDLTQSDIDKIIEKVPGGISNIQDIYALSPLQNGILFHNLLATESDPYIVISFMKFTHRNLLDDYIEYFQNMVHRHDILRTAFIWKELSVPAQVVWRKAPIAITEVSLVLDEDSIGHQFARCFDRNPYRFDLEQAPLIRLLITRSTAGRWIALQLMHHLIGDETTARTMHMEMQARMNENMNLPRSTPYRNLISDVRFDASQDVHIKFFTEMLADINKPSLPFALDKLHPDVSRIDETYLVLSPDLVERLNYHARIMNIGLATLSHVAWALVISRICDQQQVVFGTVLSGRMHAGEGIDTAIGMYINTLPLRLDIDDTSVQQSLRKAHTRLAQLVDHEYASLALAQQCSGVASGIPLFSSILNFRQHVLAEECIRYPAGIEFYDDIGQTNYPLSMLIDKSSDAIRLIAHVSHPICSDRLCSYTNQALESLVSTLDTTPQRAVDKLEILPNSELTLLRETWNIIEALHPDEPCIHQLFEEQVLQTPNAIALVYGDQMLTYAELNTRANRLAHQLIDLGVAVDQCIGLCVSRTPAMVIGLLAIMKSGGAYVPIDPAYSSERSTYILNDAVPTIALVDQVGRNALGDMIFTIPTVLDPNDEPHRAESNPIVPELTSRNLAYVIYTSGSTGQPKGVMVEHRSIVGLFNTTESFFHFDRHDTWCLFHSIAFDPSVWELWGALRAGARIVIAPQHVARATKELHQLICEHQVTVLNMTPAAFKLFTDNYKDTPLPNKLRYICLGGARFEPKILHTWYTVCGNSSPQFVNLYGPTETTVNATLKMITRRDADLDVVPIGKRLPGNKLYLLDVHGRPVPVGVRGEIYIGGSGVTRGYHKRPDLTRERFLQDPFSDALDARMYRTGDTAYYLTDGSLVYVGRNDQQIKFRDYRIEPGEIEACLIAHPAVTQALVLVVSYVNVDRIVAYVVAEDIENLSVTLHEHASKRLPEYMVPSAFVRLCEFRLTQNNKIDASALPPLDEKAFARQTYEAPEGDLEIMLAGIWCDLLGLQQVGRHDSFFALGGHSLLVIQMIQRLRSLSFNVNVRDLFDSPVLSRLAQILKTHHDIVVPQNLITPDTTRLTPDMLPLIDLTQSDIDQIVAKVTEGVPNIQDIYALSPLQDGILFHNVLDPEHDPFSVSSRMATTDRNVLDRYLSAVQRVIDRHDIFRTAFVWEGLTKPAQVVWRIAPLSITEIVKSSDEEIKLAHDNFEFRTNLEKAPLISYVITREASGRWILNEMIHHLIIDHATLEIMRVEIRAFIKGEEDSLPRPLPFRNLIAEVRLGDGQKAHKDFFTEMLGDVDEPTLPYGLADVHRDGSAITEYHHMLPSELNDQLRIRAKDFNVSLASLCHVAYGLVLHRTSGQSKVVFGTVLFGRIGNNVSSNSSMGLFINTLPLRIDVNESSLQTCLTDAHDRLAQLIQHEHASLALAQRCSSVADNVPLFSALLNFRHNSSIYDISDVIPGLEYLGAEEHTNYPITLSVEDYGSSLGFTAQVVSPICSERLCSYMQQALTSLANTVMYTPNIQVRLIEVLPVSEREELSSIRNTSRTEYTDLPCIHQLFERQAEQTPNATAIIHAQETVTYAELNARANRLAHQLIHSGLSPDERVVICTDRSPSMIVGCLAILKAGGAYVPIDPAYPSDRMSHILHDANPRFAVVDRLGLDVMGTAALAGLTVLDPDDTTGCSDTNPTSSNLSSKHLAYIIYTSGSTGKPKGVMVEHRNIVRLFCATETLFHFDRHDTWCLFHSIAFDVSVWELWGALRSGARLMIAPHHVLRSPQEMQELLWEHRITVLNLTPTAFKMFTDNYKNNPFSNALRYIILAGERFDPATLRSWYSLRDNSSPILVNMYGSTETAVHSTFATVAERNVKQMVSVIGERLPDTKLYLLDNHGQLLPCGVTGEIYIGGAGVTRGYVNRSDLTQERFLADPFNDALDARMYRTGDTAYYLEDGNLAYVGRNDEQLKIRGFRVEPSEIEACLLSYPAVRQALVRVISTEHVDRLVAYVISAAADNLTDSLHEHARARLPEYMVPSAFVRLDKFPMTRNGKVDYSALPTFDQTAFACRSYEEPQGIVESTIADIWSELLGLQKIGRHDSFFALGGHSLLAIQMIQRLRCFSLKLTVRELFDHPVLSSLARVVKINQEIVAPANRISADVTRITPDMLPLIDLTQSDIDRIVAKVPGGIANIQDIYALSPLQDGILFHNLLDSKYDPYCVLNRMTATDRSILDGYLAAAQHVVDRHDILRTAFIWEGLTVPAQVVCRIAPLVVTEIAELPNTKTVDDRNNSNHTAEEFRVNLERAPLVRYVISRESSGRWILNQVIHHLIIDHTTLDIMRSEIRAYLAGEENDLPKPLPFRNLVAEVRLGMSHEAHKNFFTDMLGDVDEPTLPFGVANVHGDGSAVTEYQQMLPSDLDDRLRSRAKTINVSLASLCHVAFALVLSKTSGQARVVFGTVLFGRMGNNIGNDSTMGLFINTLPLKLDVDKTSVQACMKNAHNRLAQLIEHEHASLALAQRCSSVANNGPLFSALLNYRHNSPRDNHDEFIPGIELLVAEERTNYPVTLSIEDYGSSLGLTAQVVPPICSNRLCAYVEEGLENLVDAMESAQDIPMQSIEILPVLEFEELTKARNTSCTEYADLPCIHHLFERQAEQTPNATAIIYAQETVTYAELNARANRLAHQLIHSGLSPDERVVICTDRNPLMIVGCLAILKAGGAYVPIDPAYPSDRMSHILHDANPRFAVVDRLGLDVMGTAALAGLTVLDPDDTTSFSDKNPTSSNLSSKHLAYIIYTSGSTGKPKGVMVEHRNIVRLFCATETLFHFDRHDTWCLFHSIAFDVSVWELWGALRSGARLMIAPHHVLRSPQEMQELLWEHRITVLNLTPTAFKMFTDNYKNNPFSNALRYIILAGERFDPATLRSWYSLRDNSSPILVNMYGSTETTVHSTFKALTEQDARQMVSSIGTRLPDSKLYLLDDHRQVVPSGALGEIYIGGPGVTRGYLNRCDLTQERFLPDPFTDAFDARMYRTGDTAYYLSDGGMAYIGRNDQQLKIRGFRVESCEVEACLLEHPAVHQAIVLIVGSEYVDRLVAYVIADVVDNLSDVLHEHASARLPEYMVPSAFVHLDKFPLTQNGKIDRAALPGLDQTAFACGLYEEPQGAVEVTLANIWSELLGLQKIGRHDSFFALGGHSLLAIQMIQRLRCLSLELSIRELFDHPVLSSLARVVKVNQEIIVPPNTIEPDLPMLTPDMLPLIDLTQSDIDRIIMKVPGGIANIQDIYALSPLQDGILFHTLLETEHDPYCVTNQIASNDRDFLDRYTAATQRVIDRHDILRTAFVWEGLTKPAQVVWRSATLSLTEVTEIPDPNSLANQMSHPQFRLDLEEAPLIRYHISRETSGRWILSQLIHHLIVDHTTLEIMGSEIQAYLAGEEANLPKPSQFRNHIAGVRLGISEQAHKTFFTEMLGNVDEPTLPFGVANVRSDGSAVTEFRQMLPSYLNEQLRIRAKNIDVSLASLCHLAYALVLSRTSDQDKVVFGTVLFGRMGNNIGNDSTMGLFINTLPLRLDVDETPVQTCLKNAHNRLAQLIEHEHASLAIAQRCSAVSNNNPLFSSLLNYRHNSSLHDNLTDSIPGADFLGVEERTNYPVSLSVEDYASALGLTVQVLPPISSKRLCSYMQQTLESLVDALQYSPDVPVRSLEVLPLSERRELSKTRNTIKTEYTDLPCIHHLIELQAERAPNATAITLGQETLTYEELNARANSLAHQLIDMGLSPDDRVAMCTDRSPTMIVVCLAILKAGGAYVPIDPAYPSNRTSYILNDAAPRFALIDQVGREALDPEAIAELTVLDPNLPADFPRVNPLLPNIRSEHLAYVIYTSGSTGKPKGVMVEHGNVVRLLCATEILFNFQQNDTWCLFHSIGFDVAVWELWNPLYYGANLVIVPRRALRLPQEIQQLLHEHEVTVLNLTPTALKMFMTNDTNILFGNKLRLIILAGERCDPAMLRSWYTLNDSSLPRLVNMYGCTETTVHATFRALTADDANLSISPIGTPIPDIKLYLLDHHSRLVPFGAVGEIYLGGSAVARGYLNRSDLTRERFVEDTFSDRFDARMYRTGDTAHYLPDGGLSYVGRNDQQVKIRGFRIEPCEVEACLVAHPAVHRSLVLVVSNEYGDRLVAYVIADAIDNLAVILHEHAAAKLPEYMVPSAFVQLDEFPLTQNGKVDLRSLPELDHQDIPRNSYEAPIGTVEMILAIAWSDLLGVHRVSRYDHFFTLGGHSLIAVRLMNILAARGIVMTLNDLFQCPVLVDLASKIIQNSSNSSRNNSICVRRRGTELPLFFFPAGSGDFSYVFPLAEHIRAELPIYILPWPSLRASAITSVQQLAVEMVSLMKSVQPKGPYKLAGYCSGGVLTYCVAHLLLHEGESVDFLGLIDAYAPSTMKHSVLLSENYACLVDLILRSGSKITRELQMMQQKVTELDFKDFIEYAQSLELYPKNVSTELISQRFDQQVLYARMLNDYNPEKMNVALHLFRATDGFSGLSPSTNLLFMGNELTANADDNMGWTQVVPESFVRLHRIPGNHFSMMDDSNNRLALAQTMNLLLNVN